MPTFLGGEHALPVACHPCLTLEFLSVANVATLSQFVLNPALPYPNNHCILEAPIFSKKFTNEACSKFIRDFLIFIEVEIIPKLTIAGLG